MKTLIIYGASDDLVEFDGAFVDEFNIYEPTLFEVKIDHPLKLTSTLILRASYGPREWELLIGSATGVLGDPIEVLIGQRPGLLAVDPAIFIQINDDCTVGVTKL